MLPFRIMIVAICAFLSGFFYQNAFAGDNGVIKLTLPDAAAVGMGTAFVGEADRPSAVFYNPAGITQIGTEVSAGITFLQPQIEFKSTSGVTSEMNRDYFVFPHIYVSTPVYKDRIYIGIGENSNFGSGNNWGANSFARYSTVKDGFVNKDYMLVAAYKINDQWSLGAGAIDDESKIEHDEALNNFISSDADALFKASDNAWGFSLATIFKLNDQNQFGLSYKSPIHHVYDGYLYLNGLNPVTVGASFGGVTSFTTRAIQKFTLPQSVTLGYSVKPISKLKVNFDLEWTDWSNTEHQTTFYPNVTAGEAAALSANNPTQRSWKSVWSESLGAEYALTDKFRIRSGYAHHQSPIPKSTIDTDFPDSDSNAYAAGFGYDITKNITVDIAYVGVFYMPRSTINTNNASINGKYKEFVNIGTATLTYKF